MRRTTLTKVEKAKRKARVEMDALDDKFVSGTSGGYVTLFTGMHQRLGMHRGAGTLQRDTLHALHAFSGRQKPGSQQVTFDMFDSLYARYTGGVT